MKRTRPKLSVGGLGPGGQYHVDLLPLGCEIVASVVCSKDGQHDYQFPKYFVIEYHEIAELALKKAGIPLRAEPGPKVRKKK